MGKLVLDTLSLIILTRALLGVKSNNNEDEGKYNDNDDDNNKNKNNDNNNNNKSKTNVFQKLEGSKYPLIDHACTKSDLDNLKTIKI